jgi:hypothetical protein
MRPPAKGTAAKTALKWMKLMSRGSEAKPITAAQKGGIK